MPNFNAFMECISLPDNRQLTLHKNKHKKQVNENRIKIFRRFEIEKRLRKCMNALKKWYKFDANKIVINVECIDGDEWET